MVLSLQYYECCRHCPPDCRMNLLHKFPCNKCQPRVIEQPQGLDPAYTARDWV